MVLHAFGRGKMFRVRFPLVAKMNKSEAGRLGAAKTKQVWIKRYENNPKYCKFCESKIPYEKRNNTYCNHSCFASYSNKKRAIKNNCLFCDNQINKHKKFCNHKCHLDYQHQEWIKGWLKEEISGSTYYGMSVSNHIRRFLKEKYGEQCILCGWKEKNPSTNKIPLQIDHIDGNSENNKPSNLRLICPNCHSLTPTFSALNKGNGRKFRKSKMPL